MILALLLTIQVVKAIDCYDGYFGESVNITCKLAYNSCITMGLRNNYEAPYFLYSCNFVSETATPEYIADMESILCRKMHKEYNYITHCEIRFCFTDLCNDINVLFSPKPMFAYGIIVSTTKDPLTNVANKCLCNVLLLVLFVVLVK